MRHRKTGRKFHRLTGRRASFLMNLTNDLIRVGRISTTVARAKEIRPMVERFVTIAKRGTLASRRLLLSRMKNERAVGKLMEEVAQKYQDRNGGYLRIQQGGKTRKRDGSQVAVIEFV